MKEIMNDGKISELYEKFRVTASNLKIQELIEALKQLRKNKAGVLLSLELRYFPFGDRIKIQLWHIEDDGESIELINDEISLDSPLSESNLNMLRKRFVTCLRNILEGQDTNLVAIEVYHSVDMEHRIPNYPDLTRDYIIRNFSHIRIKEKGN